MSPRLLVSRVNRCGQTKKEMRPCKSREFDFITDLGYGTSMAWSRQPVEPRSVGATLPVFFAQHIPQKPLSEFVAAFWYWQGHEASFSKEGVLPTAAADLVIRLGNPRPSDSGISGARSRPIIIERTTQDRLLGIHFKPGGAFPFLGFPSEELHNLSITLTDLWGHGRASRLLGLLQEAQAVGRKFQVLEGWLLQTAERPLQRHRAVAFAMQEFSSDPGLRSSAQVAAKIGFSQRRFIELFRGEVGLTPKLFWRLQRFRKVIKAIQNKTTVDWADLAVAHGYYDQSHFHHEFQEFSGLTPSEYLGLRTPYVNHVRFRS